eukprot:COSAG03_NODE_46_length_16816_cov_6.510492_9_plen_58_part_00
MCRVLTLTETRVSLYFNICSRFNHGKDARARAPTKTVAVVAAVGILLTYPLRHSRVV